MLRYLIVGNQTLSGGQLIAKVQELIERGPCSFHIVVPATYPRDHTATEGEGRVIARERLDRALTRLRGVGAEVDGEVGDEHPLYAIKEVLEREAVDTIIVSTLPPKLSRWLRTDLVHRVQGFGLPVIHVVGQPEPADHRA